MKTVIQRMNESQNFVVTSHINPDGDNVGSSVAMVQFLKKYGKNAIHCLDDEIPENLKFLLKNHGLYRSNEVYEEIKNQAYDIIVLDCAEKSRAAIGKDLYEKAACVINIDHHVSNTAYGDLNYILPEVSSTAEVVTGLLRTIDESIIDEEVATPAYTGLSTDTGNFLFPVVSENTFLTAAFLTAKGADRVTVANELYRNTSLGMRKLTKLLLDTFTIENEVGIMTMTTAMLEETGVAYKDTEAVTNLGVDTEGVEVGILIKENAPDLYKISLRSKGIANVCEIAAHFGGGGHHNAAGCTIQGDSASIAAKLQKLTEEQIEKDRQNA